MIDVKIITKAKQSGNGGGGSSTKTTYIDTTVSEADHASRADKANRADKADTADYAARATNAQIATYAMKAGELDAGSETLKDYLYKGKTEEKQTVKGEVDFANKLTMEQAATLVRGLKLGSADSKVVTEKELRELYAFMTYNFNSGMYGQGGAMDFQGNAEFNSLYVRQFISAPKFIFNEISVTKAEQWNTNGYGTIESVDTDRHIITLKLEENDYGTLAVGDICRGIYADVDNLYGADSITEGETDDCNFVTHKGFFTTYFYVSKIVTNEKGKFSFIYGKKSKSTPDPCAFMDFAQYGSFSDSQRRSSMYFSSRGRSYIEVLDGVSTWDIQPENRVSRYGWLGGLTVTKRDGSTKTLTGNGLFAQNNVYFGGTVEYLGNLSGLDDLLEEAKNYDVTLSQYQSVITVDDLGNVINGLYTTTGDGEFGQYRISTAVFARKGDKILLEEDEANEAVTAGHYRVYAVSDDCEVEVKNSTIFITGINNIKDGVAGTTDDTKFDYDAMRKMSSAMVTVVVDLEGKSSKTVQMPIRIQHDSLPFMVCDLSNENAPISWNTKRAKYIGLPVTTTVSLLYHNEPWTISELSIGKVEGLKTSMSLAGKAKTITVEADNITTDSLAQVTKLPITVVGKYAGVSYEYTKELTILKTADTVVYDVVPSVDSVVVDKDGNGTASSVSCDIWCTSSDDKRYKLDGVPAGYTLKYGYGDTPTTEIGVGVAVKVSADNTKVTFALYDKDGNLHDIEGVPVLSYGKDGTGQEYVFKLTKDNDEPTEQLTPDDYETNSEYQRTDKEYIPDGWTDDPTGVSAEWPYEWGAVRTSVNGHWGPFSSPFVHAHFGKHAARATSTDNIVTIPTDSESNALARFAETISFDLTVDSELCTLTKVSTDFSSKTISCVIGSDNRATITCQEGATLGMTSQTINFLVEGTLEGAEYSDMVPVKVVPNVTGADGDGYEYIYLLSASATAPTTRPRRSGGVLSDGWKDDPMSPTDDKRYVYVAYRQGYVGEDGEFSLPKLWAYKAKDGRSIISVNTYYGLSNSNVNPPTTYAYDTMSSVVIAANGEKWLWSADLVTYDDGGTNYTGVYCVDQCKNLTSITEQYGTSMDAGTEPTEASDTYPTNLLRGTYIWTRDKIVWKNGTTTYTEWQLAGYVGEDGKGVEYIYCLTKTNTGTDIPSNPTPSDWQSSSSDYQKADVEYIPKGWTDDPTGVSAEWEYEWVCRRICTNGVWDKFSDPAVYSHYGKHAATASVSDTLVTIPTNSYGKALGAFSEELTFELKVDGVACTLTKVAMSGTLTNATCTMSGTKAAVKCANGAALGSKACVLRFTVYGTLDGASYSAVTQVTVLPNVKGDDGDGFEYIYYLSDSATAPTGTPKRTNGVLSTGWDDDVPEMTDDKRYIYVAYRMAQKDENKKWPDGTYSTAQLWAYKAKDGDDGTSYVCAYRYASYEGLSKPTVTSYTTYLSCSGSADLGNGWSKEQPSIKYSGQYLYRCDGTAKDDVITWGAIAQVEGSTGEQGDRGIRGPIPRTHDGAEAEYYEYLSGADGEAYVDIVRYDNKWYRCIQTYTPYSPNFENKDHWEEAQSGGWTFVATKLLLAENARLEMASSQRIDLIDGDTAHVIGSFRKPNGDTNGGNDQDKWSLWMGGDDDAEDAPFRVDKDGNLYASSASIEGEITATSGKIGCFDISHYVDGTNFDFYNLSASHDGSGEIPASSVKIYYQGMKVGSGWNTDGGTVRIGYGGSVTDGKPEWSNGVMSVECDFSSGASSTQAGIKCEVVGRSGYTVNGLLVSASGGSDSHAINIEEGDVVGYRPYITHVVASDSVDYPSGTVIICKNAAAITLSLPKAPDDGTNYRFIKYNNTVTISSSSANILEHGKSEEESSFTSTAEHEWIDVIYYRGNWYLRASGH